MSNLFYSSLERLLQGPTQPPETMSAQEYNEIVRRAEELAGDSFDAADKDAMDWLYDEWSAQKPDAMRAFYSLLSGNTYEPRNVLRDRYISEREEFYRDEAKAAIEASYCTEE